MGVISFEIIRMIILSVSFCWGIGHDENLRVWGLVTHFSRVYSCFGGRVGFVVMQFSGVRYIDLMVVTTCPN